MTCRPGTSVLVLVIENLFCPHTPRPADEDGLPTSPIELTYARDNPTFGQFNRPSGGVADRPSALSRNGSRPTRRAELVRLHRAGEIHDEVLHRLENELDLEELTALRFV